MEGSDITAEFNALSNTTSRRSLLQQNKQTPYQQLQSQRPVPANQKNYIPQGMGYGNCLGCQGRCGCSPIQQVTGNPPGQSNVGSTIQGNTVSGNTVTGTVSGNTVKGLLVNVEGVSLSLSLPLSSRPPYWLSTATPVRIGRRIRMSDDLFTSHLEPWLACLILHVSFRACLGFSGFKYFVPHGTFYRGAARLNLSWLGKHFPKAKLLEGDLCIHHRSLSNFCLENELVFRIQNSSLQNKSRHWKPMASKAQTWQEFLNFHIFRDWSLQTQPHSNVHFMQCFPRDAQVMVEHTGVVSMDSLRVGDRVLSSDGLSAPTFEEVGLISPHSWYREVKTA